MFSKLTYEGVVYDMPGGNGVTGVKVELRACKGDAGRSQCNNYKVGEAITDANGHFKIEGEEARSNRYFVQYSNNVSNKILGSSFDLDKNDLKHSQCTMLYLN